MISWTIEYCSLVFGSNQDDYHKVMFVNKFEVVEKKQETGDITKVSKQI